MIYIPLLLVLLAQAPPGHAINPCVSVLRLEGVKAFLDSQMIDCPSRGWATYYAEVHDALEKARKDCQANKGK